MKTVVSAAGGKFRIIESDGFDGLYTKYKVVKGDTLGEIAKKNGTTVEFLAKVNDIENVNLIEVDQVLYVPDHPVVNRGKIVAAGKGLYRIVESEGLDGLYNKYVVVKGDTLGQIAKKFETTVDLLAKVNGIENVDLIEIDQVIYYPCKEEELETVKAEPTRINIINNNNNNTQV